MPHKMLCERIKNLDPFVMTDMFASDRINKEAFLVNIG